MRACGPCAPTAWASTKTTTATAPTANTSLAVLDESTCMRDGSDPVWPKNEGLKLLPAEFVLKFAFRNSGPVQPNGRLSHERSRRPFFQSLHGAQLRRSRLREAMKRPQTSWARCSNYLPIESVQDCGKSAARDQCRYRFNLRR
jgi:hypothetical protein